MALDSGRSLSNDTVEFILDLGRHVLTGIVLVKPGLAEFIPDSRHVRGLAEGGPFLVTYPVDLDASRFHRLNRRQYRTLNGLIVLLFCLERSMLDGIL